MGVVHSKEVCTAKPGVSDPDRVDRDKLLKQLGSDVSFDVTRPGPCKGAPPSKRKKIDDKNSSPMEIENDSKIDIKDLLTVKPEPCIVPISSM